MPINSNESIIAVPINVEQPGLTRQFLVRLIEKLDIVLGYRGSSPFVTISDLQSAQARNETELTQLERTILNTINELVNTNVGLFENLFDAIKSEDTISDADTSTQTISTPPTQAEVQAIQDQVVSNATTLNELLAALRATEIIAT